MKIILPLFKDGQKNLKTFFVTKALYTALVRLILEYGLLTWNLNSLQYIRISLSLFINNFCFLH